jgi:hypothetical protein
MAGVGDALTSDRAGDSARLAVDGGVTDRGVSSVDAVERADEPAGGDDKATSTG